MSDGQMGATDAAPGFVWVRDDGPVRVLTLNRPARKNALTAEMYTALSQALIDAEDTPEVRVVVVHGEGDAFCAGNDLKDFVTQPPLGPDSPVFRFIMALPTFTKPMVAVVHGAAVGIGTTWLLHCDLVYAAADAKLKMPFTSLALVPEAASSLMLPAIVGPVKAAELLLLGDGFGAQDALAMGLVNEVLDSHDAAFERAMAKARKLAALPPEAVRMTKRLLRRGTVEAISETMRFEAGVFGERLTSPEFQEAVTAFFEKRKPDFSSFR